VRCPVAVDVFEVQDNLADPNTVAAQVDKLKRRFGIAEVVTVGDRGMLTSTRIEALKEVGGVGWVSALCSNQIGAWVNSDYLQLSLFDQRNLVEISLAEHSFRPARVDPIALSERRCRLRK
jgi:transposase